MANSKPNSPRIDKQRRYQSWIWAVQSIIFNLFLEKPTKLLTSEKQQHKGSLERIGKLTEQITKLEKENGELKKQVEKMPGEFPEDDEKPQGTEKDKSDLAEFIEWTKEHKEFEKVDWNYYRSQENWEPAFRNWNKLRTDRISLLDKWKETKSNQQSKETNK